jgi:hypothetical protein
MRIAIYRTIFDDYNDLKPIPQQTMPFDYYCITDNTELKIDGCTTIVPQYPRKDLHPRLRAKFFKLFPFELPELSDYDITIYIDGSINVHNSNFIQWCLNNLKGDMLLFKHPQRNCIYDEFNASKELNKYKYEMQDIQMTNYSQFYPRKGGLYACGVLIRRNTEILREVMVKWWFEIIKYSWQDQVSFPVVCKLSNFIPDTFKESQYHNDYFKVLWHDDIKQHRPGITSNTLYNDKITVSVLMPVLNTPIEYLLLSIDSILTQTHNEFEFVIVDDNNTNEELLALLGKYHSIDPRIKLIRRNENKGIAAALNDGLKECTGNLIIRMDSDDIANKLLIEKQIQFFLDNPDAAICGVQISIFGKDVKGSPVTSHPKVVNRQIAKNRRGFWIVNHPGVAYKKDVVLKLGAYGDTPANCAEDFYLWCKLLTNGYLIYNQPEVLLYYRMIPKPERQGSTWKDFLIKCNNTL